VTVSSDERGLGDEVASGGDDEVVEVAVVVVKKGPPGLG